MRDLAVLRLTEGEFDTLAHHCARDHGPRVISCLDPLQAYAIVKRAQRTGGLV